MEVEESMISRYEDLIAACTCLKADCVSCKRNLRMIALIKNETDEVKLPDWDEGCEK